jgi:WAS family protein 1
MMPTGGAKNSSAAAKNGRIAPTPAAKLQFPIISHDLREEEALHATLDSLSHLSQLASTIMGTVSARIQEERTKLQAAQTRISTARGKIKKLEGTARPTRVFSSAKFPATEGCGIYSPLLADRPLAPLPPADAAESTPRRIRSSPAMAGAGSDFALPLSLITLSPPSTGGGDGARLGREGLGRLPRALPSASAMLLFNSKENPYRTYSELDNLAGMAEVELGRRGGAEKRSDGRKQAGRQAGRMTGRAESKS